MQEQHSEVGMEGQVCGWRCGVLGVWAGGGGDDGAFPSGVWWPGRAATGEWHGGGANL